MAHTHPVVDSDSRFVINSTTREISTTSDKLELIQGDHQSERITFEIPKIVEGHDMSLSDRIEVHYINIDRRTNATSRDVYIIDDAAVDGDKLTFSWLISSNATKYYGRLNFIILFECLDPDGNYTYKWNTEICKLLTIGEGISNTSAVIEDHSDILEKFKKEFLEYVDSKQDMLIQSGASVGQIAKITAVDSSGKPTAWEAVDMPSGGGVQPDWNQNDETQPDYVKNRPFYTGDTVETVFVEESTVSFAPEEDGVYFGELQSTFVPTVGETYKVSWDGTTYESTCVNFNRFQVIGNLSIMGVGSDTGEPFLANISHGEIIEIATADTSASHTFSISGFVTEVVKIDPKYIRDMYYTADHVETVFVEESTATFAENNGLYVARFPSTFEATVGEAYKVSWDGTVYECTCVLIQGLPAIGNSAILGTGSDTGEPFLMGVNNGKRIQIITADTSASHTFSISGFVSEVVKIDEKYLPDTIATKSDVEVAQTTANNAQTTANNAKTTANNAQTTANNAQTTANNAQTTANNAQTTANNAKTTANNAQTTANNAKTTANNAKTTADDAQTTANNAKSEALDLAARMFGHTSVVDNAFYRDETLSITSLPACIESIGNYAFAGCINLALTSLPSGLTSIGNQAFANCRNLALTSLPSGLTSISVRAFADCTNLALTSLPSGLTSIDDSVFTRCTNLALTSLPSGLTSIGAHAFAGCTNLALTSLPSGLTSIGDNAFAGCTNLALTSLPSGLTSIGDSMFTRCTNLALTSLPSGLTSIGAFAFADCTNLALTSLPSGLTSIGFRAFQSCTGVTSITFTGKPTTINSEAFKGCTNLTTINVPWAEGEVANSPWGATNATINYNYTEV